MIPPPAEMSVEEIRRQLQGIKRSAPDIQFVNPEHLQHAMDPASWSSEEIKANRRIIEFTAIPSLKQVGPQSHAPQVRIQWRSIESRQFQGNGTDIYTISVILFESKALITSVDIISSAECFFRAQFCTMEKNRIRRGFESSGPRTLHKGVGGLYNIVQGFSNPKPRNIDKSVKVFPASCFRTLIEKICSNYIVTLDSRWDSGPTTYYTNPAHWLNDMTAMDDRKIAHQFCIPTAGDQTYRGSADSMAGQSVSCGSIYHSNSVVPDNGIERSAGTGIYGDHGFSNGLPNYAQLPPIPIPGSSRAYELHRPLNPYLQYSHGAGQATASNSTFATHHTGLTVETSSNHGYSLPTVDRHTNGSYATFPNNSLNCYATVHNGSLNSYATVPGGSSSSYTTVPNDSSSSYDTVPNGRLVTAETSETAASSGQHLARNAPLGDHFRTKASTQMFETAQSATPSYSNNNGIESVHRPLNVYDQPQQLNGYRSPSYNTQGASVPGSLFNPMPFNSHQTRSESPEYASSLSPTANEFPANQAFMPSNAYPYPNPS
ncbi:hypothetical protein CspHIS471_0402130 [Cutaneotrichosporon sp. HIS471]|nr:hypothetical protein CspHIS471_0402130 [Cutaneotrichosporon sp. HIS471]